MQKSKIKNQNCKSKLKILHFSLLSCILIFGFWVALALAQENSLEFTLDVTSKTTPLPKIFKPNIDLSGRGFQGDKSWPRILAAKEVLDAWQNDIGFSGIYRLQYNLWEINQLRKDKDLQEKLLSNYEEIISRITQAGGVVILNIFGTPAGLGRVLDKRSPPRDLKAFKELIKGYIKDLSCDKRYNIWYEVWSAPDLDDFFLGREQDYLNLYRIIAQSIKELRAETKIHIPLGGPAVSQWFSNLDSNTILTPERSLIYELIRFCHGDQLPLDFISWYAYSSDPDVEHQATIYHKTNVALIRDWLSYFRFDKNTPLVISEWNYDTGAGNILIERKEEAQICASYILSRLQKMYQAGLDYQLYFCLEDFRNNEEGINRNVGIFWFDPESSKYKGESKLTYNIFRMLAELGNNMFVAPKIKDDFVGVIATRTEEKIVLLIYNYLDPEIARDYVANYITTLKGGHRKRLIRLMRTDPDILDKIMDGQIDIAKIQTTKKVKAFLKKVKELSIQADKLKNSPRNLTLNIKNLKEDYRYKRYVIDSSSNHHAKFIPAEEGEVKATALYQEVLKIEPYSVQMITLNKLKRETP